MSALSAHRWQADFTFVRQSAQLRLDEILRDAGTSADIKAKLLAYPPTSAVLNLNLDPAALPNHPSLLYFCDRLRNAQYEVGGRERLGLPAWTSNAGLLPEGAVRLPLREMSAADAARLPEEFRGFYQHHAQELANGLRLGGHDAQAADIGGILQSIDTQRTEQAAIVDLLGYLSDAIGQRVAASGAVADKKDSRGRPDKSDHRADERIYNMLKFRGSRGTYEENKAADRHRHRLTKAKKAAE